MGQQGGEERVEKEERREVRTRPTHIETAHRPQRLQSTPSVHSISLSRAGACRDDHRPPAKEEGEKRSSVSGEGKDERARRNEGAGTGAYINLWSGGGTTRIKMKAV